MDQYISVRDRLREYKNYAETMELLKVQIDELESRITHINSTSIIAKPEEGGIKIHLQDYVSKLADMKDEYERRYENSLKLFWDVRDLIEKLNDAIEKQILFKYYCSEKRTNLYRISKELNYSYDWVRHKHKNAIRHLEELER